MVIKITLTLQIMTMFLKTTQKYQNMFLKQNLASENSLLVYMISFLYLIFFF